MAIARQFCGPFGDWISASKAFLLKLFYVLIPPNFVMIVTKTPACMRFSAQLARHGFSMKAHVLRVIRAQFKVLNSVIQFVSVKVVYFLLTRHVPTNMFFHYKPVFLNVPSFRSGMIGTIKVPVTPANKCSPFPVKVFVSRFISFSFGSFHAFWYICCKQ